LATAARLGYAGPDPVASGLRRGRVGALGVLYANRLSYAFEDPAIRDLLAGMTGVAESAGAGLLLLPGSADLEQRTAAITGAVVSFGVERDPVRGLIDVNRQERGELAVTRDRLAGYREALGRHELDWRHVPVFQGTDSTPAEGEAGAQAVLDSNPTALICLSD